MPDERAALDAITAAERDEALRRLENERAEFAAALQIHRANELHLANEIREAHEAAAAGPRHIHHMERSLFRRARLPWIRLRGRR
jgi:hypothetical protein